MPTTETPTKAAPRRRGPKARPAAEPEAQQPEATEPPADELTDELTNEQTAELFATVPAKPRNVVEAVVAVMRDVTYVAKDQRNTQGTGYNFRGIDGTVNALGPAMRRHGLIMLPGKVIEYHRGDVLVGNKNTKMGHVGITMQYTLLFSNEHGEVSTLDVQVAGESMDSGDKATPKAMSVALRTALLQGFMLPTMEPDPDEDTYQRSQIDGAHEPRRGPEGPTDEQIVETVESAFVECGAEGSDAPLRRVLTMAEQQGMAKRAIVTRHGRMPVEAFIKKAMDAANARLAAAAPREGNGDEPAPAEHAAREAADAQDMQQQVQPAQAAAEQTREHTQPSASQNMLHDALLSELNGQAAVLEEDAEALLGDRLDTVDTAVLRANVLNRRPQIIAVMREGGHGAYADTYEAQEQNIAPWTTLIGYQPQPQS